jgi:cysteinyl-tRNA synthetase
LDKIKPSSASAFDFNALQQKCYDAMNDDFNTPVLVAHLFDAVRVINSANDGKENLTASDIDLLKKLMHNFVFDVLGLKDESAGGQNTALLDGVMKMILEIRAEAKAKKDFATSDKLRDTLAALGITIKDSKDGALWNAG